MFAIIFSWPRLSRPLGFGFGEELVPHLGRGLALAGPAPGVDRLPGAGRRARLRLWFGELSIAIDAEPSRLPPLAAVGEAATPAASAAAEVGVRCSVESPLSPPQAERTSVAIDAEHHGDADHPLRIAASPAYPRALQLRSRSLEIFVPSSKM